MEKIGTLKKVELREVWPHEAKDFTNWLKGNLDILGEAIGLDLEDAKEVKTEFSLKDSNFRVDVIAATKEGEEIIIENQLKKTDHEHLGQIMTYMINMELEKVVWIAKELRPEHISVINWFNENTDKKFYLIQLESYQIDDSKPAPFFKVMCQPSPEMREIGQEKEKLNETKQLKISFWESFLEKAKNKTDFFSNNKSSWWPGMHSKIEKTDIDIGCRVNIDKTAVSVMFEPNFEEKFLKLKESLESEVGFILTEGAKKNKKGWAYSDKKEYLKYFDKGGYRSPKNEWDKIQDEMIDHFVKLEKAFKPLLKELKPNKEVA